MLRALLVVICLTSLAPATYADRRMALVMGADGYESVRPLNNAVNDARTIEAALKELGFDVISETDRNLKRMRRALEDFREDAVGADVALVFFAGHGIEISGENRLLPIDADVSSIDALKATTLPLEEVREAVASIGKVGLIVLDACRNDPFGVSNGEGRGATSLKAEISDAVKPGLGRMGRAENVLFAFSAAPGETASDGGGENSPFTSALAKYLGTDGLEIRSVLTLVQQEVYDLSRGGQLPYVESGLPQVFFAASARHDLPERERLLLAMADVTTDVRAEVEKIAAGNDMPLAPLYGALIEANASSMTPYQRGRKLEEAAAAFVKVRMEMRTLASDDPEVTSLRQKAERQLSLGAFDTARATLASAADIDGNSRKSLKENLIARTISEATTHYLAGGAARADLRYELAISDYEKAVALYSEIENFEIANADRVKHIALLEEIGLMQRTVGNLPASGAAYERMQDAVERQAKRAPDDLDWQFNLAVAKGNVADILSQQGMLDEALARYIEEQGLLETIIEKGIDSPRWMDWMRTQAIVVNRVGDIARDSGNPEGALKAYRLALEITESLIGLEPGATILRHDMAICRFKIGMALRHLNDFDAALVEFDIALSLAEKLSADNPDNPEYRRSMTVSLNWIGDLKRFANEPAEAFAAYERSRAVTDVLITRDPANTEYRRDMSLVLNKLGDARQMQGDTDEALALHRSAIAIAEYLADLDPTNAQWQRDLSVAHNRVGDLLLAKNDVTAAGAQYKAGFEIAMALFKANTTETQRILDVLYSRYKMAMAGIDRLDNLTRVKNVLAGMKEEGMLPVANEGWITMVDEALKATR